MAQYKVLRKCFLQESRSTGPRIYNRDEIVTIDGPASPDLLQAVGEGPHDFAARRYDVEGGETLTQIKRAELFSTRR